MVVMIGKIPRRCFDGRRAADVQVLKYVELFF